MVSYLFSCPVFVDDAIGGAGQAAPHAARLIARRGDGDIADFGEFTGGSPQPGRADAIIVGEEDVRFVLCHDVGIINNKEAGFAVSFS